MSGVTSSLPAMMPSTRLAIQAAASAFAAIVFVSLVDLDRPYWVILTAVVVMVGSAGETLAKSIDRTVGTLIGLVIGVSIYGLAVLVGLPAPILLAIAAPSTVFLRFASYRLMVVAITTTVVLLLEIGGASGSLIFARLVDTVIGAAIAVTTSFLVLRLPTRRPVFETIGSYDTALAAMVHESLEAVIAGHWSSEIDARANLLRGSDADFGRLADALRMESALIGGGQAARTALAVLPVLRGHVDVVTEAAQTAAQTGLGGDIAEALRAADRQIAANLNLLRDALETGEPRDIPRLDDIYRQIEARLKPRLQEGAAARRDVVAVMNVMLALRRLNRGLRNVMTGLADR